MVMYCIIFLFFFSIDPTFAYDIETPTFVDNFNSINDNVWITHVGGGQITLLNGLNLTSENSRYFPFVSSKINIFPPTGNFYLKVKFKYTETTPYGVGFGFGNITPVYGLTYYPFLDSDFVKFQVWQSVTDKLNIETRQCNSATVCSNLRTNVLTLPPNLNEHSIFVVNKEGVTNVYFDNSLTLTSPFYNTNWRPTVFWMGHLIQLGSENDWTDIKIISIETGTITESVGQTKTILIPGLGASWDIGAILTGNQGGNWVIPSFVTQYDGLINSFVNAGYTKDTDLFIFAYDWRKPLSVLADRLKNFIDTNIPPGEKVNIVGHSMGGLVARAYAQTNGTSKVNKIVTIGTPNMGVTKAYGVWEGATVWDDAWWTKIAIELTTHFGAMSDEIQTIRTLVPSIKDLLPTYNYLKFNNVLLPWSSLTQKNDYLNTLNQNISSINSLTTAIYSNNVPTDKIIGVVSPSTEDLALNKWVDGKPDGNSFEQTNGDGTVIEESARGLFSNTIQGVWWHGELVTKKENVQKLFNVLGLDTDKALEGYYDNQKNVFVASLQSPGVLEVCNIDISKCNDQLGLYFPDNKLFILPGYNNENLIVRITEDGTKGGYNLHLGNINDFSNWKIIGGNLSLDGQIDLYNVASDGQSVSAELVDTIAPTTPTIIGFHNPELLCGGITNLNSVTVDWTDSIDNRKVVDYEYFVDYPLGLNRGQWNTFFTNTEYRGSLNEGVHYIKIRARDSAGNYSQWSNTCSITADWTAPIVNISSPIPGTYMQNFLPELKFTATDNIDTELTIDTSGMPNSFGQHTVTVTATDDAGNIGSAYVSYIIQNPPSNKEECKKNGWTLFGLFNFRNQGDCVSYYEKFERLNSFVHIFTNFWR